MSRPLPLPAFWLLGVLLLLPPSGVTGGVLDTVVDSVDTHLCALTSSLGRCHCPRHREWVSRFLEQTRRRVFGQDEGLLQLTRLLQGHAEGEPLAVHIAGDNGVGKTFVANLLAESMFTQESDAGAARGLLYIRASALAGLPEDDVVQHLRQEIFQHLLFCPHALVVVDEVQALSTAMLSVFVNFLDATIKVFRHNSQEVRIDRAAYVFISDFGSEGVMQELSREQVEVRIQMEVLSRFALKGSTVLSHHIVFYPYHLEAVQKMLAASFTQITAHRLATQYSLRPTFTKEVQDEVEQQILLEMRMPANRLRNYRAVKDLFQRHVTSPLVAALKSHVAKLETNQLYSQLGLAPKLKVTVSCGTSATHSAPSLSATCPSLHFDFATYHTPSIARRLFAALLGTSQGPDDGETEL